MFEESAYRKLLEEVFARHPSVQQAGLTGGAYKPGLERMEAFARALGHPERQLRCIHVAGTNGKGSVASMVAAALSAVGLRTALYTSPHLLDFRERLKILGIVRGGSLPPVLVPKEYVYDFISRWRPVIEELDLSFFEITTGMALRWFADEKVDAAVIEVGLGGRLDSTNIITPDVSVITSIGLDHCALLGDTRAKIAFEKAGIIKKDVPAVIGEDDPETRPVYEATASPLVFAPEVFPTLWEDRARMLARMDLQGEWQAANLRTALAALDILRQEPHYAALADNSAVKDALLHTARRTGFRGRWERLASKPDVIADIGHNPPALKGNFARLARLVEEGVYTDAIVVYAVMADKDLEGIFPYFPSGVRWIFSAPATPRALPPEAILSRYKAFCAALGREEDPARTAPSVARAVEEALAEASKRTLVYIGGSTFAVAEAIPLFEA